MFVYMYVCMYVYLYICIFVYMFYMCLSPCLINIEIFPLTQPPPLPSLYLPTFLFRPLIHYSWLQWANLCNICLSVARENKNKLFVLFSLLSATRLHLSLSPMRLLPLWIYLCVCVCGSNIFRVAAATRVRLRDREGRRLDEEQSFQNKE